MFCYSDESFINRHEKRGVTLCIEGSKSFQDFLTASLIASPRAVSKVYNRETSENYSGSWDVELLKTVLC